MSANYLEDIELRQFEVIDNILFTDYQEMLAQLPAEPIQDNYELLDDGLTIVFDELILYHGSATRNIKNFKPAEDDTIGKGLYTTSSPYNASRYALIRSRNDNVVRDPVLYTFGLKDYRFVDLRTDETVSRFMPTFADFVEAEKPKIMSKLTGDWHQIYLPDILDKSVVKIREGRLSLGTLKGALQQVGSTFKDYVESIGADGIVAYEGGEFSNGTHDSWVIMKPERAKPIAEIAFKDFVYKRDLTEDEQRAKQEKEAALEARFGKPIPPYTPMDQIHLL